MSSFCWSKCVVSYRVESNRFFSTFPTVVYCIVHVICINNVSRVCACVFYWRDCISSRELVYVRFSLWCVILRRVQFQHSDLLSYGLGSTQSHCMGRCERFSCVRFSGCVSSPTNLTHSFPFICEAWKCSCSCSFRICASSRAALLPAPILLDRTGIESQT